ncbi:hypothetical protein TNCV_4616421 [Trichonephila clavipes]|nr:hypothetical protein TNCV_4616421 [Trichonephila clavipes]
MSAGKVKTSVFWNAYGIFFVDFLEKGKTITSEYCMTFLDQLNQKIKKKRPQMQKKSTVSPRQCSVPQVQENNGQIERIALRITCPPTVQSRSSLQ